VSFWLGEWDSSRVGRRGDDLEINVNQHCVVKMFEFLDKRLAKNKG
jgi:hypothetical protein